jgi:hypothetical protein
MVRVKKTLHVDENLLKEAKLACSAETDTETIRLGLETLIRHAAYQRLRKLLGTEHEARRHRRKPAVKLEGIFDLGASGGSDVARNKDVIIAEAFSSVGQKSRRRPA